MKLLLRTKSIKGIGTFGELTLNGELFLCTVEKEWANNKPYVSCIPAGDYDLVPHKSPKFGECYALVNPRVGVAIYGPSERTHCLIHIANFPHEVVGCIGVGESFHTGQWGVANSTKAMAKLMKLLDGERAKLTIERH
ncbi:conserved hypothetical protein [Vibrio chagasii]|uniref:DUF5675 domain-containing protein n=1 Tax=Vibrio cyclitrophicus TaxID=47951 RepID=A0A7Z1MME2_9VIBR|nr:MULTISPECIES: DUF5675 family protein [Vibrio]CAH6841467.1 conserved hypothetical protein [Vibrio chagasii]PME16811.1 hypothetical protein BCV44_13490 [Vibrio cyclitrophicus]PMP14459.1 hypothetical protein BCS91_11390 [Vibrio cyclitrophicus]PMP32985.1 hypothetical protein BCS90_09630 [Vibrio cyclitrophicus]TKF71104.1 hypothetical protein FCV55_08575 [Vibrio sp. F13]